MNLIIRIQSNFYHVLTSSHAYHFNGHFSGKPGFTLILILQSYYSKHNQQVNSFIRRVLWAVPHPHTLTATTSQGVLKYVCCLLPNQQR